MILFTIVGSFWLEFFLKVGVIRRLKRAFFSIAPTAALFLTWDYYAVTRQHWFFDKEQVIGIFGPAGIPLEEFLFFIFVPLAGLMTIEAVRRVKPHWSFGDEVRGGMR